MALPQAPYSTGRLRVLQSSAQVVAHRVHDIQRTALQRALCRDQRGADHLLRARGHRSEHHDAIRAVSMLQ